MFLVLKRVIENGKRIVVFRSCSGYSIHCPNHPLTQTQTSFPKFHLGTVGKAARLYNLWAQGYGVADGCYSKRLDGNIGKVDVWRRGFCKHPDGTDCSLGTDATGYLGKWGCVAGLTSLPTSLRFLRMVLQRYPHDGQKCQCTSYVLTITALCLHPYVM